MKFEEKLIRDLISFSKRMFDDNYQIISIDDVSIPNIVRIEVKLNNHYTNEISFTFLEMFTFLAHRQDFLKHKEMTSTNKSFQIN